MEFVSIAVSVLALMVSITTLWLTYLRRGHIKMTQPTMIFFGPDGGQKATSKVFLRTLLYSTSKRGNIVENFYVRLCRGETQQNFSTWIYGEENHARGSGLFVGPEGVSTNHHFLTPTDVQNFQFAAGDYQVQVFCKLVNRPSAQLLSIIRLRIGEAEALKMSEPGFGIFFDWGPDSGQYQVHVDQQRLETKEPASPARNALRGRGA